MSGGEIDSSGAFTISEQAAREKLARYTLVHPSLYVLELLGVAVLGRAHYFRVTTPGGDTCFRFNGQPLSLLECQQALGQMFESSSSRRLACLGLALTAAHGLAGGDLTLTLPEGVYAFDGQAFHKQDRPGEEGVVELRVPGRYGFVGGLFRRAASLEETLQLAACAPLEVSLDGRWLSEGFKLPKSWMVGASLHWTHPSLPLHLWAGGHGPRLEEPSPGDFSAIFVLLPVEEAVRTGLTVVHQGVSYRVRDPEFNVPGVSAVVMSNALERNLSRSEILWNSTYQSLREHLLLGAQKLIWATLESPERFHPNTQACQASIQWAFDARRRQGVEHAQAASWLAVQARLSTHPTPQALADLALEQIRLNNPRKAEDYRLAAIALLLESFRRCARSRELDRHLSSWSPMLSSLVEALDESRYKASLRNFLAMVEPLRDTASPTVEQRIQRLRLQGRPAEAAALLSEWKLKPFDFSNRVPIEVLLAVPRSAEALTALLDFLGYDSVAQALAADWPRYRLLELDLLADILEYRNDERALVARQLCVQFAGGVEMRYLTSLEMCRHARAKGQMAIWIRARARASYYSLSKSMSTVDTLTAEHPLIGDILEGRACVPPDLDGFLLPVCDALGWYNDAFPYLTARLAHRLRLAGKYTAADQLLARVYTLRSMDRCLSNL